MITSEVTKGWILIKPDSPNGFINVKYKNTV